MRKSAAERGLTVLELVLATFLFFVLTVSFLTIRQRKANAEPIRQCVEKKWQWTRMADEIEWRLRRWEILGSLCLKAGFLPVGKEERSVHPKIWNLESVAPVVRKMSAPNQYPVPPGFEIAVGQRIIACSETAVLPGTVKQTYVGTGRQSLIEVAPEGNELPMVLPPGSFIVALKPITYEVEEQGPSRGKILYEKMSAAERKPLGSGFEDWFLAARADRAHESVVASLEIGEGECRFVREFPLVGQGDIPRPGRWWIREGELYLEPWLIALEGDKK